MFKDIDEIYNYIGQSMFNVLPDEWSKAQNYVLLDNHALGIMSFINQYQVSNISSVYDFRFDNKDILNIITAYKELFEIMQKNENDVPRNKARFEMTSEGDFSIDFKYDEDFVWYKSLDINSQEYDDLDIDVINQIKSWEGLPESYHRYWAKTLLILPNIDTLTRGDVSAFTLKHNNSALLKEHWQDKYSDNAMQLWEEVKQAYKNKAESKYSIEELIFVLNYDFAVMPYQNSEEDDLGFYKWIFIEISKLS